MRWLPRNVAWFALEAGWPRILVPEATLRAMVTSEGDDSYQWPSPPTSYASHTGLWGLETLGWADSDRLAQHGPLTAAQTAWQAYQEDDGWDRFLAVNLEVLPSSFYVDMIEATREASPILAVAESPDSAPIPRTFEAQLQRLTALARQIPTKFLRRY